MSAIHTQWQMAGTFVEGQVNAGGSARLIRKALLQGGSVLQHEITRTGRDQETTRLESRLLMIAIVHFEPNSTLRDRRVRLRTIHERWPRYLVGVGILIGDFSTCEPEQGRLKMVTQNSDGDPGRTAVFRKVFPHALEIAQQSCAHRMHNHSVHDAHTVCLQARTDTECMLVAQDG